MKKFIKYMLFNLGQEVVLKSNSGQNLYVKKEIVNGKVFGATKFNTTTILLDKNSLAELFAN